MAVAKAAVKPGTAVAKPKNTNVVSWEQELAKHAAKTQHAEASTGQSNNFSTKNAILTLNGNPVDGNKMDVVIVDYNFLNAFYEDKYDANKPVPPICFAFGDPDVEDDEVVAMAPHADSKAPQHEGCHDCEHNQFGSGDNGKGKACKNSRRLALVPADQIKSAKQFLEYEAAFLQLPVTSLRAWGGYVKLLSSRGLPPFGVVTEIKVQPDPKNQVAVLFAAKQQITSKDIGQAIIAKRSQVRDALYRPYSPMIEEEKPKARARGGKAKY